MGEICAVSTAPPNGQRDDDTREPTVDESRAVRVWRTAAVIKWTRGVVELTSIPTLQNAEKRLGSQVLGGRSWRLNASGRIRAAVEPKLSFTRHTLVFSFQYTTAVVIGAPCHLVQSERSRLLIQPLAQPFLHSVWIPHLDTYL